MKYTFPLQLNFNWRLSKSVILKSCGYDTFIHNSQQWSPLQGVWVSSAHVLCTVILYKVAWLTNAASRTAVSRFTFACIRCYAGSMKAVFWTHRDATISCVALGIAFAAVFYRPCLRQGLTTQTALLINSSTNMVETTNTVHWFVPLCLLCFSARRQNHDSPAHKPRNHTLYDIPHIRFVFQVTQKDLRSSLMMANYCRNM
jgi:hypothetical protein